MSLRDGGQVRVSPIGPADAKVGVAEWRVPRRPECLAQMGGE
jgi:hypothetical protein